MKTILIVDDNPANIGLLFDCLNHEGFKTLVAQDGKSAVSMASRLLPDLILLDVIMPDLDGFDTCRLLKEAPEIADIPVFFMTALTDTESKVKGFECGAVDFISKPFQQEEVLARIHAHLTIQDQKKSLIMANRIKEKVMSVVAHDLRNPFTAIFAYHQLLSDRYDEYDDLKRKSYISKLESANRDLFDLVDSLMAWITTGEGEITYTPRLTGLKDLVASTWEAIKPLADKKSIQVGFDISDQILVHTDANMLASVVRNLLTNALKFTPRKGRIEVRGEREGAIVFLSVQDTGVGVAPADIEAILSGNKLSSTQGTEEEAGTGIGLMICREFMELMGGRMSIESCLGKGSTFKIELNSSMV